MARVEDVSVVGLLVLDVRDIGTDGADAVAAILETESKVEVPENCPVLWYPVCPLLCFLPTSFSVCLGFDELISIFCVV